MTAAATTDSGAQASRNKFLRQQTLLASSGKERDSRQNRGRRRRTTKSFTALDMSESKASTSTGPSVAPGSPAPRNSPEPKNSRVFIYLNDELQLGPRFHYEPKPMNANLIGKEWGIREAYEVREPTTEDRTCREPEGFITVFLDI